MKVPDLRVTSLRTKMIVTLVPLTVLILSAMTAIAVTRMTHAQKQSAYDEMGQRVSREAADYDAGQERALSLSRTLAGSLVPRTGLTRAAVGELLKTILKATPETAGVWVAFEPDAFDGRVSSGRRAIILVSDGGARLDARAMRLVADGLKRNRIALYFIYLRSGIYSPDLNAPTAATEISAESALHRYFLSLQTPDRLFQAGSAKAMTDAVTEIDRQQDVVTSFVEQVPRRDVSAYCFALALSGCVLLLVLRLLQVRAWS